MIAMPDFCKCVTGINHVGLRCDSRYNTPDSHRRLAKALGKNHFSIWSEDDRANDAVQLTCGNCIYRRVRRPELVDQRRRKLDLEFVCSRLEV